MITIEQEIRDIVFEATPTIGRPRKEDLSIENHAFAYPPTPVDSIGPSEDTLAQAHARQERNAMLALERFGFGSLFWPTLQDMAEAYPGLETRERVRQLLNKNLFDRIKDDPRPAAKLAAEIIESRDFWAEDELIEVIINAGLSTDLTYARGLLDYLQAQGLAEDWKVVKPDLTSVKRAAYDDQGQCFVLKAEVAKRLSNAMKRAQGIVGPNGLCRLSDVGVEGETGDRLLSLMKAHNDVWVTHYKSEYWYTFDDRRLALIGSATKTFSLVQKCDLDILSEILRSSLNYRASKMESYPESALIKEWITRSDHFKVDGATVTFRGEPTQFTDTEADLIDILEGQGPQKTPFARDKLIARGHGAPLVYKVVFNSPLVYIDKSAGKGNYTVTLVSDLPVSDTLSDDDYFAFKSRLESLAATDKATAGTGRQEQRILSEWIFRDKTHICCAMCGRDFARGALITAHKKKRANCTETERCDPNIVFPLCVFGCDYLYEKGFVRIRDGKIALGKAALGDTETSIIAGLIGREVDPRWLAGPSDYFDANFAAKAQ